MVYSGIPLTAEHDVADFDCGNDDLNRFLRETARQHIPKGISRSFVEPNRQVPGKIHGFFTLAMRRFVSKDELPREVAKKLPREVPAITLARLAVNKSVQGRGLGEHLLVEAMQRALESAEHIGGWALFVDAKDHQAAAFYKKFGFMPTLTDPLILFIPIASIPRH
jgi:GNAT superfamily N-acetyltransferase